MAYFMALPRPVLSNRDIGVAGYRPYYTAEYASLIWNTWSKDPFKAAVLRAILSARVWDNPENPYRNISMALSQNRVAGFFEILSINPHIWRGIPRI